MKRKIMRVPLYRVQLVVYHGSYDELSEINKQFGLHKFPESVCARSMWDDETNRFSLLFRNDEKITGGCIVHECKHMVNLIFRARGIELDIVNDEPECYLLEWLVDKILSIIKIQ